jgi:hypothetical protein
MHISVKESVTEHKRTGSEVTVNMSLIQAIHLNKEYNKDLL